MRPNSVKPPLRALVVAGSIMLGAPTAFGQSGETTGYLIDQRGVAARSGGGLCWRTGYWTPAMASEECDPDLLPKPLPPVAQLAPAPPPPPPAPAPRPVPASEKYTLAADTLFDFDRASLRPEGRAVLDDVVGKVAAVRLEVVIVVGHADRIGKERYNLLLSERRAESVKAYLVDHGIAAEHIHTEGMGERQPVTGDSCRKLGKESRDNRRLVACLQPDRRVTIEVIGTRDVR